MMIKRKKYRIKSELRFTISVSIMLLLLILIATTISGLNTATCLTEQEFFQVEVQHGDTLWDIAKEHMPNDIDPRKAVHIIENVNKTSPYELQAGQVLDIPVKVSN